jgi:AAA domain
MHKECSVANRLENAAVLELENTRFLRPTRGQKNIGPAPLIQRADELLRKQFEPIRWAIRDLIPEGVSLLVGAPKVGKSWLALQFGIAISGGAAIWTGRDAEIAGDVLILALEDNDRRMQSRIAKLRGSQSEYSAGGRPESVPDVSRIHFATQWGRMDQGGLDWLKNWLADFPDARLVIIDTLGRFRAQSSGKASAYQEDYEIGAQLKPIADTHNVAVVLLHHTRKAESSDVLDSVSGTQGLSGSVDALLLLRRERGQMDAALYVTGRDIEHEQDYALKFNADACTWSSIGTVHDAKMTRERLAILDFLTKNGPSKPKDIAEGIEKRGPATRRLLQKMFADAEVYVFDGLYSSISPLLLGNRGNSSHVSNSVHGDTDGTSVTAVTGATRGSAEAYRAAKDGEG